MRVTSLMAKVILTGKQHLLLLIHADKDLYMSKLGVIFNLPLTSMPEP
jgi:hypothetical protein